MVVRVERARVGDVLALDRTPVDPDPGVEYITIGIRSFGKGVFHYDAKPGDGLGKLRFFEVRPDRLLVSNIKGWEGAIAVSDAHDAGCLASNRFLSYRPVDDRVDVGWARWFFLSERGLPLIQQASPGSADRNRTLAIDRFENLEILLPPIDEQRRVADRLDRVARAAVSIGELIDRSRLLADAMRSSLATRQRGPSDEWARVQLGDVLALRCEETPVSPRTVYPMAGVYSFGRGLFPRGDLEGAKTSYKVLNRLSAGQLVMSQLKAWEGALALVPPEFDGHFLSPEFPTFDVKIDVIRPQYLGALLTSETFWSRLKARSQGLGARKERVSAARLLEMDVELPTLDEQLRRLRGMQALADAPRWASSRSDRVAALLPAALNAAFAGLS